MKYGIVDVGSNTMRLSIYHLEGEQFKLLTHKKIMAGLAGYIQEGELTPKGMEVAIGVLRYFQEILHNLDIPHLSVFGTAPLRNISNTEAAVDAIQSATGITVEVLSGVEEAHCSFTGALSCGSAPKTGLLADIGGGSTELVAYREGVQSSACSLPIGSLSLYTSHVSQLFPTKEERRTMLEQIREELNQAKTAGLICPHLTGVGGTIRSAAKLWGLDPGADGQCLVIPAQEIRDLYKGLKKGNKQALRRILRTVPDRVHTVVPGLAILKTILDLYQVETVSVSPWGVREGYLLEHVMGGNNHG